MDRHCGEEHCNIKSCPVLNPEQCPVRLLWKEAREKTRQAEKLCGKYVVNMGRISSN